MYSSLSLSLSSVTTIPVLTGESNLSLRPLLWVGEGNSEMWAWSCLFINIMPQCWVAMFLIIRQLRVGNIEPRATLACKDGKLHL